MTKKKLFTPPHSNYVFMRYNEKRYGLYVAHSHMNNNIDCRKLDHSFNEDNTTPVGRALGILMRRPSHGLKHAVTRYDQLGIKSGFDGSLVDWLVKIGDKVLLLREVFFKSRPQRWKKRALLRTPAPRGAYVISEHVCVFYKERIESIVVKVVRRLKLGLDRIIHPKPPQEHFRDEVVHEPDIFESERPWQLLRERRRATIRFHFGELPRSQTAEGFFA